MAELQYSIVDVLSARLKQLEARFDLNCTMGSWGLALRKQCAVQIPQEVNEHTRV